MAAEVTSQPAALRLSCFLSLAGYVESAWRLPAADPLCNTDIEYFCGLARTAEDGGFDALFVADSLSLWSDLRRRPTGTFEPSVLAAVMLRETKRIGAIITLSTTFNEPYNVARRLASLDLLSGGRIGWNIVTTADGAAARNFGLNHLPSHAERYARADEFVRVCRSLWRSWGPDALLADKDGDWGRPDAVVATNHRGPFFEVAGPLDVPRTPQVDPLLVQAGSSDEGLRLAAAHADVVFTVQEDVDRAVAFRSDVRARGRAAGRSRPPAVMPGVVPFLADTEEEALELRRHLEDLVNIELAVAALEDQFGVPSGTVDVERPLDIPLPPTGSVDGNQGLHQVLRDEATRPGATVGDVVRKMQTTRGHLAVCGTADKVAARLLEWHECGAADGFNVIPPTLPGSLERFAGDVVPRIRDAGYRAASGNTLRERFGCPLTDP